MVILVLTFSLYKNNYEIIKYKIGLSKLFHLFKIMINYKVRLDILVIRRILINHFDVGNLTNIYILEVRYVTN